MYEDACTHMYVRIAVGERAQTEHMCHMRVCVCTRMLGMVGVSLRSLPTSSYVV